MLPNKKYDAILFTDMTDYSIPIKTSGAYKIASHLRHYGYSVKVIDNFVWILKNHKESLFKYLQERIGTTTLFVGFSTTFMSPFKMDKFKKTRGQTKKEDSVENFSTLMRFLKTQHPQVKIVLGGQGVQTGMIFDLYKEIDYWIKGLAEDNILEFITKLKSGIKQPRIIEDNFLASEYNFRESIPMFGLQDNVFQNEVLPIEISRGCRFKCKFCSYPLLGRKPSDKYIRSEESLYKEFLWNYTNFGTTQYMIMCDTFNETTEKILSVKRAIDRIGIDINFWSYIRMDLIDAYPEQLEILRDIGIRGAFLGIESLYDPSSKAVGKGFGRENTIEMVKRMKDSWGDEVLLHGAFMIGLPHETPETATEWCKLLDRREILLDSISMNALRIFPNQKLRQISTSRVFHSEFDINAEQYGYIREKDGWRNEFWTQRSAQEFAEMWKSRFKESAPDYLTHTLRSANLPMSLLNGGFKWEEILKTDDPQEFQDHVKIQKLNLLNRYAENVFTQ